MRNFHMIPVGSRQSGFTLIELMVALVIGLIIMVGAIQLFLVSKSSFDRVSSLAERQETLRFISDIVSLDVRTASGFSVTSGALVLSFDAGLRPDDPYCPSGDLNAVEYSFSGGNIEFDYACGSGSLGSGNKQPLVGGVESFTPASESNGVSIEIIFPAMPNEASSTRGFEFKVTSRSSVMAGI